MNTLIKHNKAERVQFKTQVMHSSKLIFHLELGNITKLRGYHLKPVFFSSPKEIYHSKVDLKPMNHAKIEKIILQIASLCIGLGMHTSKGF